MGRMMNQLAAIALLGVGAGLRVADEGENLFARSDGGDEPARPIIQRGKKSRPHKHSRQSARIARQLTRATNPEAK